MNRYLIILLFLICSGCSGTKNKYDYREDYEKYIVAKELLIKDLHNKYNAVLGDSIRMKYSIDAENYYDTNIVIDAAILDVYKEQSNYHFIISSNIGNKDVNFNLTGSENEYNKIKGNDFMPVVAVVRISKIRKVSFVFDSEAFKDEDDYECFSYIKVDTYNDDYFYGHGKIVALELVNK